MIKRTQLTNAVKTANLTNSAILTRLKVACLVGAAFFPGNGSVSDPDNFSPIVSDIVKADLVTTTRLSPSVQHPTNRVHQLQEDPIEAFR